MMQIAELSHMLDHPKTAFLVDLNVRSLVEISKTPGFQWTTYSAM